MRSLTSWIQPSPPFSLELTANYQTSFQGEVGADVFENNTYRRLLEWDDRLFLLSVVEKGSVESSNLEITILGETITQSDLKKACKIASHLLATDVDLGFFQKTIESDPLLTDLSKKLNGLHPPRMPSVFEGLIFAISGQQISSSVARRIRTTLVKKFGPTMEYDGHLYHAFPSPQRLFDLGACALRDIKLSQRKTEYILNIALEAIKGQLDLSLLEGFSNETILERLDALPGVGRWTAEWVLLRALGRLDVFPAGDLALRRILSKWYFQGCELSEDAARAFSERWSISKALVLTYLFAAYRLEQLGRSIIY
ncbi:DNA-3-methyladenine glycosylase [Candidatus Bathyarchaeota archaeon]|nr:DNA-3-methyladenine glycosylase [Candidatus Bathyarchaeota archaeon]